MRASSRLTWNCVSIGAIGALSLHTCAFSVIADNNSNTSNNALRVAIIGCGVGGASTSYFLRELVDRKNSDCDVTIDVYEKNNRVGGRVMSTNLAAYSGGSLTRDIGATIIIKQNQYMMNFAQNILKLKVVKDGEDSDLGLAFFDEPRGRLSAVMDGRFGTFKLIKQWGFLPFMGCMYTALQFVKKFGQIYEFQQNGTAFDNAIDLWDAVNLGDTLYGNGMEYVDKQIYRFVPSFLKHTRGVSPCALQLVTGLTRNNYTQDPADLPPIVTAAAVSTLAAGGLYYVADGGNKLIEAGLIEQSNANLKLNCEIKSITKNSEQKYVLNGDEGLQYDYVIIAAPLSLANIKIEVEEGSECTQQMDVLSKQEYMDVHKHYVKGKLNAKYFGFYDNDPGHLEKVGTILSSSLGLLCNASEPRVTQKKLPCTTIGRDGSSEFVRFMGAERFTEETLDEIMESWDPKSLQRFHFKAYPKFKWNRDNIDCLSLSEQKKVLSFCMDRNEESKNGGLYYLNVLECGMSAMEVMAVAGKNVALLVSKQIASSNNN